MQNSSIPNFDSNQKKTNAILASFIFIAVSIGVFSMIIVAQLSGTTNTQSQAFLPVSFCAPNPCASGFSCTELEGGKCYISDIQSMSAYTDYEQLSSRIVEILASCDSDNPGNITSSPCDESSNGQLSLLQDDLDQLEAIVLFQVNETKNAYEAAKKVVSYCQSNQSDCDADALEEAELTVSTIDTTVENAKPGNLVTEVLLSTVSDRLEENP